METEDMNLSLKEFLIILGITLVASPIGYAIVFAPMGWWM